MGSLNLGRVPSMRISRQQAFMQTAHIWAMRSTCSRLNVGAVCVVNNRIVSVGYNGRGPGEPHCQGNECPGREGCQETIHAERNALGYLPRWWDHSDKDLYCTDSCCQACAELMLQHRVKRFFFDRPYRITEPLAFLEDCGVEVYRVIAAGYVIRWKDQSLVELKT